MVIYNPVTFGNNIRRARERIYMSRDEFADKLFRDKGYIQKLETGKRIPTIWDLPEIARVLETTVDSFYEGAREVV